MSDRARASALTALPYGAFLHAKHGDAGFWQARVVAAADGGRRVRLALFSWATGEHNAEDDITVNVAELSDVRVYLKRADWLRAGDEIAAGKAP
jgi:hypothetical protein